MTVPVATTLIFLGGLVAIKALGRWARQVTEALGVLLAIAFLVLVSVTLCDWWPNAYANPRVPIAMTATPYAE